MKQTLEISNVLEYLYKHDQAELAKVVLAELEKHPLTVTQICNRPHLGSGIGIVQPYITPTPQRIGPYMNGSTGGGLLNNKIIKTGVATYAKNL